MNLWHGTYEFEKDEIIESGVLDNTKISETTKEINDVFLDRIGKNPRKDCIYFSGDTESADGYEYAFKVDTDDLDLDKLFVGDFELIENILKEESDVKTFSYCKRYNDTLITFEEYLEGKHDFISRDVWKLEFLYFDKIFVTEDDLD